MSSLVKLEKRRYLDNTYLFELKTFIVSHGKDDRGSYVLLDETIFYPQGGGQPSDEGVLQGDNLQISVTMVRQVDNEIRHYISADNLPNLENLRVSCFIDKNKRLLNARYHTAAHLLGNVVESLYPKLKATKGHSFPNQAYVEFQGADLPDVIRLQDALTQSINSTLAIKIFEISPDTFEQQFYKLPYSIPANKAFRVMQIAGLSPIPCGGTHLSNTSEIGNMIIGKVKAKNDIVHISYGLV
jgi:alanyl-tRNA synthetase